MDRRDHFQVVVKSEPELPESDSSSSEELRSWIVSLQVCLSGAPVEIESSVQDCQVSSRTPELSVTCLGQADCCTLVYSVQEMEKMEELVEPVLSVVVTPLYHASVAGVYKLDQRLAQLVGRDFLVHPKYILTTIHSYARSHKLYHQKTIKCDDVLYNIFEKEIIDLSCLWKEVCKLLKKVELKTVNVHHKMSSLTKFSTSQVPVKVDANLNLYPENWKFESNKTGKSFVKTQSLCPSVKQVTDKRRSFKRNKSFEL